MSQKTKAALNALSTAELQVKIDAFIHEVAHFFAPEIAEEQARKSGFVQRQSKLTGHLFLTIFTFGMSLYGTPTLNQLVGLLTLIVPEVELQREGLHQRINEQAVEFFEAMLSLAIKLTVPHELDLQLLASFQRILLFDSTSFQLPPTLTPYFKGSGGDASTAVIKILFGYDLKSAQFFYLLLHGTDADHLLKHGLLDDIHAQDLEISDLGFFGLEVFAAIAAKGAFFLSRLKTDVTLYQKNAAGEWEVFDLVAFVQQLKVARTEVEVYLKNKYTVLKTRLVIEHVPPQVKAERLRKLKLRNQKRGRQTKKRTKILQAVNLHITNAPAELLPAKYVRQLYAIRWQIELIFKSWKSNFALAKVTGTRPQRIKCMLYAKLLFIFISTKLIRVATSRAWRTRGREVSAFQAAQHILIMGQQWLRAIIIEPETVHIILSNAIKFIVNHCLKAKSKQRVYPLEILKMIELDLA